MGAFADKVLTNLGYEAHGGSTYDPSVTRNTTNWAKPVANNNGLQSTLGSIAHSVGNVGGQIIGGIGSTLHNMFVKEPAALGTYIGNQLRPIFHDPFDPNSKYRKALSQIDFEQKAAKGLGQPNNSLYNLQKAQVTEQQLRRGVGNLYNLNAITNPEYRSVSVPVATTIASVGLGGGGLGAPSVAEEGASLGSRVATSGGNFAKSIFAGKPIQAFSNPLMNVGANLAKSVAYNQLVTRPTLESIEAAPGNVKNIVTGHGTGSDYLNLGGLALPGAITAAGAGIKAAKPLVGGLFKNGQGVFDMVKIKGDQSVFQALKALEKSNPKKAAEVEQTLKVFQDYLLHQHGDVKTAAKLGLNDYLGGKNLSKMSLEDLAQRLENFHSADVNFQRNAIKAAQRGVLTDAKGNIISAEQAAHVGAVKSPAPLRNELVKTVRQTKSREETRAVLQAFMDNNRQFASNAQNQDLINAIIREGLSGTQAANVLASELKGTRQVFIKGMNKEVPGYVAGLRSGIRFNNPEEVANLVHGNKGILSPVADLLSRAGLSPVGTNHGAAKAALNQAFSEQLKGTTFEGMGGTLLQKIFSGMDKHPSIVDPRMFTKGQLDGILGNLVKNRNEVADIQRALKVAYGKLPAEITGLGPKAINKIMSVRGLGTAQSQYLRAKGAMSYSYNPFFQVKQLTKSSIIGFLEGGNPLAKMTGETDDFLREKGYFNKYLRDSGLNDFMGTDMGMLGKDISEGAKINRAQQHIVGSMAESLARAQGKTVKQVFEEGGPLAQELDHAIRVSLGYPKTGYLQSPLAKTLNVLVFPSRFNTKVIEEMGKYFAKRPPAVQIAMVNQIAKGKQWLDSPQGHEWVKQNADLIKVVNYFSPTHTVGQLFDFLKSGKVADLGQIGGMPLGFIGQMLKSAGVQMPGPLQQSEHADEETGQVYSQKIGTTDKAKLQLALQDLVGSIFSYPGATVGLPSKTKLIEGTLPMLKPDRKEIDYVGGSQPEAKPSPNLNIPYAPFAPIKAPEAIHPAPIYKAKKTKAKVPKLPSRPISSLIR